mgnify:CR=1 FL=1
MLRARGLVALGLVASLAACSNEGELVIEDQFGVQRVKLPAGHAILYPSSSLRQVTPLTRGGSGGAPFPALWASLTFGGSIPTSSSTERPPPDHFCVSDARRTLTTTSTCEISMPRGASGRPWMLIELDGISTTRSSSSM